MSTNDTPAAEMMLLAGKQAQIAWRRSTRARRVSLKIDPCAGGVVITLPPRASRRTGLALLRDHENWVAARLAALPQAQMIAAGQMIPVCGEPHLIVAVPSGRGGAWIEERMIKVAGSPEFLSRRVSDALRQMAGRRFAELAMEKAQAAGVRPKRVRVKDTRTRWGSCAPDGTLMFCWRLIMAPDFVQDYVVGHEVAHLRHMNHGPRFWALTEQLTPHREAAGAWLDAHGQALLRIG